MYKETGKARNLPRLPRVPVPRKTGRAKQVPRKYTEVKVDGAIPFFCGRVKGITKPTCGNSAIYFHPRVP